MLHTVVLSDIHLCEAERETGLWMRYRQPACSPAPEIAAMLGRLRAEVRGDHLTLVLNGDVFDFDAPRVIGGKSVFHDAPRDPARSTAALAAILDDHPDFVRALGDVLADGHDVVFVSGNHDVQLTLPEVRAQLADRLSREALPAAASAAERADVTGRVHFRSWFHRTPDGIVVEHGHQYDAYCAYRHPAFPYDRAGRAVQPTLGSLVARNLAARMGYFNPHVDGTYELSALGYFLHWARYYALTDRSLVGAWAVGALRSVLTLLRARLPESRARRREGLLRAARESGASLLAVARHARLFALPVEDRLHLALRVLWLDRAALAGLCALALVLGVVAAKGALLAAVVAPVLFAGYEAATPKEPLAAVWARVRSAARAVARIHRARAVVFGHTHCAEGGWEAGVFYGNSGSWSAAFRDPECTVPLEAHRPFIWLRSDGSGALAGGLARWRAGRIEQDPS